jgi:hypothetical protein
MDATVAASVAINTNTMLDAALAYAAMGWAVFPLAPGTKKPLIAGGGGFKAATTDEKQIREWWTDAPEANIGVATGKISGITVVDVDIKPWADKRGDDTLRELTDKHGVLPFTLMQNTWSGGKQIVFAFQQGAPNSAGCYGKHLDGRNDGGYVVVPPSRVAEDEREGTYAWLSDPRTTTLAPMPTWLMDQVDGQKKSKGQKFTSGLKTVQQMAGDGRNNALTSLAGTMRRRDVSEDALRAALLAENARFPAPLDESEIEVIVQSAVRNFAAADPHDHDHEPRDTDQYHAEQLALVAGDRIRFNDESGKWFVYDGRRWASRVGARHHGCSASRAGAPAAPDQDGRLRPRRAPAQRGERCH